MPQNLLTEFVSFKLDNQVPLKGGENKSDKSNKKNGATEKET